MTKGIFVEPPDGLVLEVFRVKSALHVFLCQSHLESPGRLKQEPMNLNDKVVRCQNLGNVTVIFSKYGNSVFHQAATS